MRYDFDMEGANAQGIPEPYFFIGLSNRFNNSFQAAADGLFSDLSWKQVFFINCVALFDAPPTIRDMAVLLGCSHQNAKQLLNKLERAGYVRLETDGADRRKQRICLTEKAVDYRSAHDAASGRAMEQLFAGLDAQELQTAIRVLIHLTRNIDAIRAGGENENLRDLHISNGLYPALRPVDCRSCRRGLT